MASTKRAAHMTQAELSEKIDISEKYLSRIERGKQLPSIVIVARLCEVLSVSADELLGQSNIYNSNAIQNEMSAFSVYEQERIEEIIKIILEIKNHKVIISKESNLLVALFFALRMEKVWKF